MMGCNWDVGALFGFCVSGLLWWVVIVLGRVGPPINNISYFPTKLRKDNEIILTKVSVFKSTQIDSLINYK